MVVLLLPFLQAVIPRCKQGFEPLVPGFIHVPFNNIEAIKSQSKIPPLRRIMVEPDKGEGGIIVPDEQYLQELRALCDEHGWLLIADEIQCGMGNRYFLCLSLQVFYRIS